MFKLYSKGCEYTLRALMNFHTEKSDQKFSPKVICQKAKIPESYTQKIFQSLVQKGILTSSTGPRGGYSLAKDPKDISILEIIKAVDGDYTYDRCIMGLSECEDKHPCPIHGTWKRVRKNLMNELTHKSLHDIMKTKKHKLL